MIMMQNLQATNRESVVAGSFYSNNKEELTKDLSKLFKNTKTFESKDVNAIIVPHAGYVYSAKTAALAYKTLQKKHKNVFLIGSSHHVDINGASIYNIGNYETPLGEVKVNQDIVSKLIQTSPLFTYHQAAHTKEHTLEVQLPFLQTLYAEDLRIVPIIIATHDTNTIYEISKTLQPYFNDDNLFVISTDLSHFPNYEDANNVDLQTLKAIGTNDIPTFIKTIVENEELMINNLQTSACGWASVLTLMHLTQNQNYSYELLEYINSGDTQYGDKKRVVGYGSMRVYKELDKEFLHIEEKKQLLQVARLSLDDIIRKKERVSIDKNKLFPKLQEHLGAFVTLYKDGKLRGCIGRFEPNQALYDVVVDMAIAAALHDTRFSKVIDNELNNIRIEVSVLTPRKRIKSLDEIVIGKHGIYIQQGTRHGTYLPHVATQMNWNVEQFVQSCAIEKAGIRYKSIDELELFTYESIVFGEN